MPAEHAPVGVGIVGLGNISATYLSNLSARFADAVNIIGCTDLDESRVQATSTQWGIRGYGNLDDLLSDPAIELVLNLTTPQVHASISATALSAGKHVYSEKPLAVAFEDAQALLNQAQAAGLLIGCAPDTFLGDGLQTCRRLMDQGRVGAPVAATAFMICHGHENWHPAPAFFYQTGAGPLLDMGPYYLTALVSLIGPISEVMGFEQTTFPTRTITSEPLAGSVIDVEVPTHVAALLRFTSGATATLVTTFDVWAAQVPHLEVYGTLASMHGPDPNTFGGPVLLREGHAPEWTSIPVLGPWQNDSRGLGVADLAHAIRTQQSPRASGAMALHVLEAMHGIHVASTVGRTYQMTTTCSIPEPLQ